MESMNMKVIVRTVNFVAQVVMVLVVIALMVNTATGLVMHVGIVDPEAMVVVQIVLQESTSTD